MNIVRKPFEKALLMHSFRRILWRRDVGLCAAMAVLFVNVPEVDLWVANLFFDDSGFFLQDHPLVYAIYRLFANIHFLVLAVILSAFAVLAFYHRDSVKLWRKRLRYLLVVLLIAPGILVNVVLKDNSIGRPRPVQVEQFGGEQQFTPAFVYSGQCPKNCSFTSGHAAIGFFFISFGWLFRCPKIFTLGMLVGAAVSVTRILQGGHFLSDVVFSFWVVYFTGLACAYVYQFNFAAKPHSQ